MDKKTLYEKAERAFNQAFDAAKHSVKVVSEKAGEAAQVTKLLIEKAALEHRVTKKFAQIGGCVYEQAKKENKIISLGEDQIKALIEETRKLDMELARVESALEQEKQPKKSNGV